MDLRDHNPIYESPDGGKTVFVRIGDARIHTDDVTPEWIDGAVQRYQTRAAELREEDLWRRILAERHRDPDLASILDQAKALYLLRREPT